MKYELPSFQLPEVLPKCLILTEAIDIIMRPTDKAAADSRSVQSVAIIKNTGHGNFVIGRFHTRARNGSSVWD